MSGHWGVSKTLALVRRRYEFPEMAARVTDFVQTCDICVRAKADHHLPRGLLEPISIPTQKWQSIAMDWVTGLPVGPPPDSFDSVLMVTDRATKMCHLIPTLKTTTAEDTASSMLLHVFRFHGLPRSIISDRDAKLMSTFWKKLCDMLDIQISPSSAFHPQTNGQAKRANQTMKQLLRIASIQHKNWVEVLHIVEMAINSAPLAKTAYTPFLRLYTSYALSYTLIPDV